MVINQIAEWHAECLPKWSNHSGQTSSEIEKGDDMKRTLFFIPLSAAVSMVDFALERPGH